MNKVILALLAMCIYTNSFAQNSSAVDSLIVIYKLPSVGTQVQNTELKIFPSAQITLKTTENIFKLYFRMRNPVTNEYLYQSDYTFSSTEIVNAEGILIFKREGLHISIEVPQEMLLQSYSCEVQTEDINGNLSELFSKIQ